MPISKRKDLMYQVMENMVGMIRVVDSDNNVLYMNRSMREEFGDGTGKKCHSIFCNNGKCADCISMESVRSGVPQAKEIKFGEKMYRIIASPATDEGSAKYSIEIFYDITNQKQLEEQYRKHYEKLKGDIEFAKQIQKKTLPEDKVYWNAVRSYSSYLPSEDLSGDLFDIYKINDDIILFYIADVSGHGVRSALMTIFLRQVIRGMKAAAADPIAVLDELIKDYRDLDLDKEQFISLIYGVYNKQTRGLSLTNAGHNCMPIIIENGGSGNIRTTELEVKGMPVCSILSVANHEVITLQMEKGDRILLYTDGVTEAFNRDDRKEFGEEGLMSVIQKLGEAGGKVLADGIIKEAKEFAGGSPMDDMAVLILELL